jgi:hypothetical protein
MTENEEVEVTFRKYEQVWQQIAKAVRPVRIRVPKNFQRTFIQAVRKEKTIANVRRKSLGMPSYGRMATVVDEKDPLILIFSLEYNGDLL